MKIVKSNPWIKSTSSDWAVKTFPDLQENSRYQNFLHVEMGKEDDVTALKWLLINNVQKVSLPGYQDICTYTLQEK